MIRHSFFSPSLKRVFARAWDRAVHPFRADETVIEAALGEHTGRIPFWEIADTGLSTGSQNNTPPLSGKAD